MRLISETVPRRDAGPELTGTYLQRVSEINLTSRLRSTTIHRIQSQAKLRRLQRLRLVTVARGGCLRPRLRNQSGTG